MDMEQITCKLGINMIKYKLGVTWGGGGFLKLLVFIF